MRPPVLESPYVIGSRSIAELRSLPVSAFPLPESLRAVAEEVRLPSRSERLCALLASEQQNGREADLLCDLWRAARTADRAALRCLMSLLEVRYSGLELLRQSLRPVRLVRACRRAARGDESLQRPHWRDLLVTASSIAARAGVAPASLADPASAARAKLEARAGACLEALLDGEIREVEIAWLRELADAELRATSLTLSELAEKVGGYDGRRIARLLPVLSQHEERIRDTRELLVRLPDAEGLVSRSSVLETRLGVAGFDAVVRDLASRPEGAELAEALDLLRTETPLAAELSFGAGVVRAIADRLAPRGTPPLEPGRALLLSLRATRGRALQIELASHEVRATSGLWKVLGVSGSAERFAVAFDTHRHRTFLPEDGVPELIQPGSARVRDLREIVLSNVQNEHVLTGLLNSPRVSRLPGLIEMVALRSRSIKVLLEICNRRDLYTGIANGNVPRTLLWHPSAIPVGALRKFVHVRFVDRTELASLAGRGSRARPEVRQLAAQYLETLSST